MRVFPFLLLLACLVATASAIKCYVCNTLLAPECEHNYEKFGIFCPLKSFGGKKSIKAIGCRISRQHVGDEHSLVRECAYTGENVDGKSQKGSLGVGRVLTQCDTMLCNPAPAQSWLLPASVTAVLVFFRL